MTAWRKISAFIELTLLLLSANANAQPVEYHFCFEIDNLAELNRLSDRISIDNVEGNRVWAYANSDEMAWFVQTGISFELCEENDSKASGPMATTVAQMHNLDCYPTYEVYDSLMRNFEHEYPQLCKLEVVATLPSGRQMLAVKISKDVRLDNTTKPEVLCTATMHGDEGICATTALNLCHHLLNNYGTDSLVNRLVDSVEFWIIPIFNPDGMYRGGNNTISGATRSNGNSYDLNRNYPRVDGSSSNNPRQAETIAMIEFFERHHFSLSTNLHSGSECFNYPWDTWSRTTADDSWWRMVGGNYRDTVQTRSLALGGSSYFNDNCNNSANGLTNGYAWYSISGGQQDWANYFAHCREVTIELSGTKAPSTSAGISNIWQYNKNALLYFYAESLNGVRGTVTNDLGQPLAATVTISSHDKDGSWIETDARAGDYHRYLKGGTYNLTFEAEGYEPQTIDNVKITDGKTTWLNVVMSKNYEPLELSSDSIYFELPINSNALKLIEVSNISSIPASYTISNQTSWLTINKLSETIAANSTDTVTVYASSQSLPAGNYSSMIRFASVSQTVMVNITLDVIDTTHITPITPIPTVELTSITISSLPAKLEYKIGDTLNVDGGSLKLTYSNDSTATVGMRREMITNFNSSTAGTKLLNVNLNGFVSVFSIIVRANDTTPAPPIELHAVTISSLPTKLEYKIGDTLNVDGGTLKLTYSNDSTATISMRREMITNFNSTTAGTKLLNVTLNGFVSVFSVVIRADSTPTTPPTVLQSVAISSLPTKLEYRVGETLNVDGGTLKLTYSNDSTAIIDMKREMITNFDSSTTGSKLLKVNIEGLIIVFSIKVTADDTKIQEPEAQTRIDVSGRVISIENANSEIFVYDINGRLVAFEKQTCTKIPVTKAGIYIVKSGNTIKKVAIR